MKKILRHGRNSKPSSGGGGGGGEMPDARCFLKVECSDAGVSTSTFDTEYYPDECAMATLSNLDEMININPDYQPTTIWFTVELDAAYITENDLAGSYVEYGYDADNSEGQNSGVINNTANYQYGVYGGILYISIYMPVSDISTLNNEYLYVWSVYLDGDKELLQVSGTFTAGEWD